VNLFFPKSLPHYFLPHYNLFLLWFLLRYDCSLYVMLYMDLYVMLYMPFSETVIDYVELVVAVCCKYLNHMLQSWKSKFISYFHQLFHWFEMYYLHPIFAMLLK
jgi:hypothetical protein